MAIHWVLVLCMATALVSGYPSYIQCDLKVISGKVSAGLNVMTTSQNIMGSPPSTDNGLVSSNTNTFSAGSTVAITFGASFSRGVAHATAGSFTVSSQFSSVGGCVGTATMIKKSTSGMTSGITWTAPGNVNGSPTVTLSFAAASGYSSVSRKSVTLSLATTTTTTATPSTTTTTPTTTTTTSTTTSTATTRSTTTSTTTAAMTSSTISATTAAMTSVSTSATTAVTTTAITSATTPPAVAATTMASSSTTSMVTHTIGTGTPTATMTTSTKMETIISSTIQETTILSTTQSQAITSSSRTTTSIAAETGTSTTIDDTQIASQELQLDVAFSSFQNFNDEASLIAAFIEALGHAAGTSHDAITVTISNLQVQVAYSDIPSLSDSFTRASIMEAIAIANDVTTGMVGITISSSRRLESTSRVSDHRRLATTVTAEITLTDHHGFDRVRKASEVHASVGNIALLASALRSVYAGLMILPAIHNAPSVHVRLSSSVSTSAKLTSSILAADVGARVGGTVTVSMLEHPSTRSTSAANGSSSTTASTGTRKATTSDGCAIHLAMGIVGFAFVIG